jgi:hypothetical protein
MAYDGQVALTIDAETELQLGAPSCAMISSLNLSFLLSVLGIYLPQLFL